VWYFIESLLPLIVKPSGADPSSSGAAEPLPNSPSVTPLVSSTSALASSFGSAFFGSAFLAADFFAAGFAFFFESAIDSTSSITTIGALSPLRGPSLVIRV
jgi:hypothetical protein